MRVSDLSENKKEGLYAAVKFSDDTIKNILDFCKKVNIPNVLKSEDFHSTLAYSRKPVPDFTPVNKMSKEGSPDKFEIWESPPNAFKKEKTYCLVLKYNCGYMKDRFNEIMDMGATYDYDEYKPHVTISYDVGKDFKLSDLPSPKDIGKLKISKEYSEVLDLDKTF